MRKILALAEAYSVPLLLGIVIALIWSNLSAESYHHFIELPLFGTTYTVHFLVKDVFMALFFGIAAAEIVEAIRPGGALHPLKKAVNPLLATVGGVLGPVVVFLILATVFHGEAYYGGWGIVTATDIALAWVGAKLIFGLKHPAVKYLLLLAVADDAIGLAIIGVFYPSAAVEPSFLILCGFGMLIAFVLREMHAEHYGFYLVLGGIPCWLGLYLANVEPALALVLIVPFLPSVHRRELMISAEVITAEERDFALESFYYHWKPIVDYGLFFFGLVSAGVLFSNIGIVTVVVVAALLVGKAIGIFGCGILGGKLGFPLPEGMNGKDLLVVAIIAGVGLTVSLFICDAAFDDAALIGAAKMGALFSIAALPLGCGLGKLLKVDHKKKEKEQAAAKG